MNRKTLLSAFLVVALVFGFLGVFATAGVAADHVSASARICRSDADCPPHFVCCLDLGVCGSRSRC
jgi:hypothetical protein